MTLEEITGQFKDLAVNAPSRLQSLGAGTRGATAFNFENCGAEPNIDFSASHQGFLMSFNSDINWHTGTSMPPQYTSEANSSFFISKFTKE